MKKFKKFLLATLSSIFVISSVPSAVFAEDNATNNGPDLYAKSAISIDLDTNEIIYSKEPDLKAYPASITKLMTGLLLAENKQKTDNLTYTEGAKKQPPFSYGLNVHPVNVGDKITAENAMDTLLLYSGNDIAYMIADNVGGTPENFAKMMNEKAKELNMTNSHFVTPNGLDDNTDDHYSTAFDIAKLTKAAYSNEWVRESMGKKTSEVGFINGSKATLENRNKLLGTDGCVGGKTGYTEKAGKCLATVYEKNGRKIIGVVMNSKGSTDADMEVFEDMQKLMDYSFNAPKKTYIAKDSVVSTESVNYKVLPFFGPERTIELPLEVKDDVSLYDTNIETKQEVILNEKLNPWTIKKDAPVGKLKITQKDYTAEYDLYTNVSKGTIIKDNLFIFLGLLIGLIIIITLIVLIVSRIKRRKRRNYRRYY